MDCDDLMLLLAKPGHRAGPLAEHLAGCPSCSELADQLSADDRDDDRDPLIGEPIGAYRIAKLLGAGGMGRVYLALHPEISSRVAIKVFSKDWAQNPDLVARFFAEARATNAIAHENIVNVLDVGRLEDGRPYLVMEHLPGQPLSSWIGKPALTDQRVVQLMLDVLSGLGAAHERGIIHRDLKPDNIFVSPEWRATLLDFGIAKLLPDSVGASAETVTGTVLGTPHYMSPEQAKGEDVDARADVYSMGVLLYECMLGRRPFVGASMYGLLDQHVNRQAIRPRSVRPELGEAIEEVILTALEKRRADRFDDAGEMRVALAACDVESNTGAFSIEAETWRAHESAARPAVTRETVASPARNKPTPAPPPTPRSPIRRGLIGLVAFGAVAAVAFAFWPRRLLDDPMVASMTSPMRPPIISPSIGAVDRRLGLDDAGLAVADAAATPDGGRLASSLDAGTTAPKPERRGTRPLALLPAATRLAAAKDADAMLLSISLRGVDEHGRLDRRGGSAEVTFDFISATRAARYADRNLGLCLLRVHYAGAAPPTIERRSGKCNEVQALPAPRCSMEALFKRARARELLPNGAPDSARLWMRGTHKRALWEILIGPRRYNLPAC